jgi:hypothetical protein
LILRSNSSPATGLSRELCNTGTGESDAEERSSVASSYDERNDIATKLETGTTNK